MEIGNLPGTAESTASDILKAIQSSTFMDGTELSDAFLSLAASHEGSGSGLPSWVEELAVEAELISLSKDNILPLLNDVIDSDGTITTRSINAIESDIDELTGQASTSALSERNGLLERSQSLAIDYLNEFKNLEEYSEFLKIPFGEQTSEQEATDLIDSIIDGSADINLEIVQFDNPETIAAFSDVSSTIFISEDFLDQNIDTPENLAAVWLEEWGHYLDSELNVVDSQGDEGEIFSGLVRGFRFDTSVFQAENDQAELTINGSTVLVEQAVRHSFVPPTNRTYWYQSEEGSILTFRRSRSSRLGLDIQFRRGLTGPVQTAFNVSRLNLFNGQFVITTDLSSNGRLAPNLRGEVEFVSGDQRPRLTVNAPRWFFGGRF